MIGVHCWIVLQPVDSDWPGVCRFLTDHNDRGLIGQIYAILSYVGTELPEIPTTRTNGAWPLRQEPLPRFSIPGRESGLAVEVFPCSADGVNLDTDPIEPRGE